MPRRTTTTVEEGTEAEETQYPEHPLFPLEDEEKSIDVSFIQITRFEEGAQKYGACVAASELMTEQDIENRWGGGDYIIIARAASKLPGIPGRFRKHRRLRLPGLPKPLSSNPTPLEENMANPKAPAVQQTSPMGDPMAFMTVMLQMQQQAAERERQASERFMTMFMGIMQGSKADSQQMIQLMLQMSTQQQQSMMQFMATMLANRGGGPEEMAKYADLLKALGMGGNGGKEVKEEAGIGKMLEDAADLVQGMVQLKNSAMPTVVAVEASPQAPPQNMGGASSLLRR